MKRSQEFDLRRYVGDLNALCGWKDYLMTDGPSGGVRAVDFKNGRNLEMTVVTGRGFDVPYLSYKGKNMGFLSKQGIRSPGLYQEDGVRGFLKQFSAGMLTTCGITYAGAPGEDGRPLGLHGPLSNLPAHQVCVREDYEGDDKVLRVEGKVREACVFEENMLMTRRLTLETERDVLRIHDTVENQSFARSPVMLIYHINFGWPMLDEGARVYASARRITPVTPFAEEGMDKYDVMEKPVINRDEQCYFHTEPDGPAFAMLHNEKLGIAAIVRYDEKTLPILCEWKCMRAGDYALGLEPTTSGTFNRGEARRRGWLTYLEPGESRDYRVELEFTDDEALIDSYRRRSVDPR